MPLYDFECPKCELRFEELVKAGEVPLCPNCSQQTFRLLPRRVNSRFHGSGFYTTDYGKKKEG